jgi:hypothetical protein
MMKVRGKWLQLLCFVMQPALQTARTTRYQRMCNVAVHTVHTTAALRAVQQRSMDTSAWQHPPAHRTHPGIIDSAYTSCVAVPATRDDVNSVLKKYENEISAALKSQ